MKITNFDEVLHWYTVDHLTCDEIAKRLGNVTRQGVWKRLKNHGVESVDGEWVNAHCGACDKEIRVRRKRWRVNEDCFCNRDCQIVYLTDKKQTGNVYKPWRHGGRIARIIVAEYFDLKPEHVVHHEDSNQRNNDLKNLMVFANNSDHLKWHHGKDQSVKPIWQGTHAQLRWKHSPSCYDPQST